MNELILENERIDDLEYKGFKIIQNPNEFCFGVDAVLLANFPKVKKGDVAVDFGTGTGIIPILLAAKTNISKVFGIEIQEYLSDMAKRSVNLNNISDKVSIINDDLINWNKYITPASCNLITCNPPYKDKGTGIINPKDSKAIARHEVSCTLEEIIKCASRALCYNGKLCMIHRPQRLIDIICYMRKYNIEPKRIRFVHPNINKPPTMVLIEGSRNGKVELKVENPLFILDEYGNYSKEINEIYNREKLECI